MASTPETTSSDYKAMLPYWDMVSTMLEGADVMRAAGTTYLPRFPNETPADYTFRAANAKFTNIFADIVNNLAAKPFAEKVLIEDKSASPAIEALAEDIDGRGNNLHVFAGATFFNGIANAVDWILVDHTKATPREDGRPLNQSEEAQQGLRPYWVRVPAKAMLAVYSATINGKEEFVHARVLETATERKGFDEVSVKRVRVFNREPTVDASGKAISWAPATYQVWQETDDKKGWAPVEFGPVSIGIIPLVPFITGRRDSCSWRMVPPMKDAAYLQVEHYQQETALKSIKELTAFPMLAGNGVQPQMKADNTPEPVPVGPRTVLYAPPFSGESSSHGEWKFIEPSAESLRFLAEDVKNTEQQLRELGRQPLTAQTGNLTVVSTAFAAQKGNSAIQSWALNLKDALEQAFKLTAMWLKDTSQPVVQVYTDFALEMGDDKGPDILITMRAAGDISQETLWDEMRRRNILSAEFDAEAERAKIEDELPDEDTEVDVEDALPPAKPQPEDLAA